MIETICVVSLLVNVFLAVTVILLSGSNGYYKGKVSEMDDSGWEDEAKFWRNKCEPKAEAKRIENERRG
jgi:hypothetical protein